MSKVLYIDLDNTLVDFMSGVDCFDEAVLAEYDGRFDEIPNVFSKMLPNKGAVEAFNRLSNNPELDVYILSTAPWENPSAWSDKLNWVKKFLGANVHKRLILSHHKNLNKGWALIDDRVSNGAGEFEGHLIRYGLNGMDWENVVKLIEGMI